MRERLLKVAERHFAEFGYEGASQRAIQREVDVSSATANYYFGTKQALYQAVIDRYLPAIVARRVELLAAVPANLDGKARLKALLAAYMRAHLEVSTTEAGRSYGRILVDVATRTNEATELVLMPHLEPARTNYLTHLRTLFPGVDKTTVAQAFSFAVSLMLLAPYDLNYLHLVGPDAKDHGPDVWVSILSRFAAGGFEKLCGPPAG